MIDEDSTCPPVEQRPEQMRAGSGVLANATITLLAQRGRGQTRQPLHQENTGQDWPIPSQTIVPLLEQIITQAGQWQEMLSQDRRVPQPGRLDAFPGTICARGPAEVAAVMKSVAGRATRPLLWARTGLDNTLWVGMDADSTQTWRNLDVRVLLRCHHSRIPEAGRLLRQTIPLASQIRVVGDDVPLLEFLIVNEKLAYVGELDQAGDPVLRELNDPLLVQILSASFGMAWESAVGLGVVSALHELIATDCRRAVLEMLIDGAKDETIARNVGISLRTCRRYIADIIAGLDASSRFQAGHSLARAGRHLYSTTRAPTSA